MESDANPPRLEYAPPSLRTRLWLKRGLFAAWVALTFYLLYDKFHLRVRLQFRLMETQREAGRFVEPADRVVFEADRGRAYALLTTMPGYDNLKVEGFDGDTPLDVTVSKMPGGAWREYMLAVNDIAWWSRRNIPPSQPVLRRGELLPFGWVQAEPFVAFLHERRARGGEGRVVAVFGRVYVDGSIEFSATVMSRGTLLSSPKHVAPDWIPQGPLVRPLGGPVRLFAPQPDAVDPSRFTIPYESGSGAGVVDGQLNLNDTVTFTVSPTTGPATRPAAPVQP